MEETAAAAVAAAALTPGGTWEKKPAAAAAYQSWALLDPTILEEDPAADSTGFAVCTASDGREVRVSLRLAEPPSSSYLQLRTDAEVDVKPTLLAADASPPVSGPCCPGPAHWHRLPRQGLRRGGGLYKFVWGSDDKLALDGLMFWVDYHRGLIYCDVFDDSPVLQFIQLPGIDIWDQDHDYTQGRQLPRAYRTVSKTSGFKITTWSLKWTDLKWVKDSVLQVDDLWSLPNLRYSPLPRWVPEYPVVSKQDSNIIHFILRGPQSDAKAWIITLDMRNAVLKSYRLFTNEQNLVFEDDDVHTKNIFCDTPFISSYKEQADYLQTAK
ncbi:hypothetical protein PAHAL_1G072300 [Panicum hallii]|uniref:DUF1618 domain-containing protein n=1 Tax=Panicum hallii TaxID=206008 RepID=A0A2T8KUB6_9POAL|nr:hypothetical protein PAHAL_1G072300 [Panicum hallii]